MADADLLTPLGELATDDAVTAERREMKFVYHARDAAAIRGVLEGNLQRVRFGAGAVSRVNSIYFDDDRLSGCEESLAGVSRRWKLRLRWYDRALPGRRVFFEEKIRRGIMIAKQRVALEAREPLESVGYRAITSALGQVLDRRLAGRLDLRGDPAVLVAYRREHFRDRESGARVTLDYDIEGFDQRGKARPNRRGGTPIHDLVVVEVKTPPEEEVVARRLLFPLRPRLSRCSKYVQCCERQEWSRLNDRHG